MSQVTFPRTDINQVILSADEYGILVVAGWTVAISWEDAERYVEIFDTSPDEGFYRHGSGVILSHRSAKITLTEEEAQALVKLIQTSAGSFKK